VARQGKNESKTICILARMNNPHSKLIDRISACENRWGLRGKGEGRGNVISLGFVSESGLGVSFLSTRWGKRTDEFRGENKVGN